MIIRTRRRLINEARAFAASGLTPPGVEAPDTYLRRSATAVLPREAEWLEATADLRKSRLIAPAQETTV
jgi:hypothetical protein